MPLPAAPLAVDGGVAGGPATARPRGRTRKSSMLMSKERLASRAMMSPACATLRVSLCAR